MSNLVKDLADTLRAVVAGRATRMPIEPILPQVKAVLERAEAEGEREMRWCGTHRCNADECVAKTHVQGVSFSERIDAAISAPHVCDCGKAVREEREAERAATVEYLRNGIGRIPFYLMLGRIERGEHRNP